MPQPDLDDPDYARFAWARFRLVLAWMTLASAIAAAIGIGTLWLAVGPMPFIATAFSAAGIFFTVLLAATLMGLVFLSSGSGHDNKIEDPTRRGNE